MDAPTPSQAPVVEPVEQPVVSGSRAGSRTKTRPAKGAETPTSGPVKPVVCDSKRITMQLGAV